MPLTVWLWVKCLNSLSSSFLIWELETLDENVYVFMCINVLSAWHIASH